MKKHQDVDILYTKSLMEFLTTNDVSIFSPNKNMKCLAFFISSTSHIDQQNLLINILGVTLVEALLSRLSHVTNRSNRISG